MLEAIVYASCATDSNCQDTVAAPDLSWLMIPALILVVLVIGAIVYFAARGAKGR